MSKSKQLPAFDILRNLHQINQAQASKEPNANDQPQFWTGVAFTITNYQFLAPLNEISEILHMPSISKAPGTKNWFKGLANVRGRLLPVSDLNLFLDAPSKLALKNRRMLVVEKNDNYLGLIVDEIMGIKHFANERYTKNGPAKKINNQHIERFCKGFIDVDDQVWHVFNFDKLQSEPQFLNAAI